MLVLMTNKDHCLLIKEIYILIIFNIEMAFQN